MVKILVVMVLCFNCMQIFSESLGNPDAPVKGVFNYNLSSQPTTLNPLSSSDNYASQVQAYVVESLGKRNIDTYEYEPYLASAWDISKDGLTYEFELRKNVKWFDGKPLTAQDVKFSFDAIVDPDNKYETAHIKSYFENIDSCEVLNPHKVRFKVKKKYFKNFEVIAGMDILPKHIYSDTSKDNKKKLNKTIIASGPYKVGKLRRGKYIELVENENWWGRNVESLKDYYKFEKIRMRFIKEPNIALQRLEKGDIDFDTLRAEDYVQKTKGKNWGKKLHKHKVQHDGPQGYGFIAWNLQNDLFKSKKTRLALYKLLDRQKMIEKFLFGMSEPARGPWYNRSVYADPNVEPVKFDRAEAIKLLKEDGWKDSDGDFILDKVINGKKHDLSFSILLPNDAFKKYLVIYQQDAKKAGVKIDIRLLEWNSFVQKLDERSFEAVVLAWSGGSVDLDPKQIWHSESSKNKGSNFISYNNPEVDTLIEKARVTLDKDERIKVLRKVYKMIAEDVPYAFLFNSKYTLYANTDRMGKKRDVYGYDIGHELWWMK